MGNFQADDWDATMPPVNPGGLIVCPVCSHKCGGRVSYRCHVAAMRRHGHEDHFGIPLRVPADNVEFEFVVDYKVKR